MEAWGLLGQIVVLLAAALLAGGVLARLKQSPLLGYILAGMFLGGPGSLRLVESEADLAVIAEIGVSLLLFSLGLEFSWERLRTFGARALVAGVVQVVGTAAIAAGGSIAFGLGTKEAIAVGAMLSLSSTAAVLRVLAEVGESDSLHGRNAVSILLTQDMALVPLAILMTLLAGGGSAASVALDIGRVLLMGAGLVIVLYVALNKIAVRALGALSLERNRELTVLLAVVVGLGATWAAHSVGLSPALGAFVAGMFLGGSPFATQVRADVSSLRIILVTLFFAAAGMVADPIWIARNAALVLAVTALILVGKALVIGVALRALGHRTGVAVATGLCLCQIGEFAFVLGGAALETDVISRDTYMLVVSSAIVSLFATPYLIALAPRCAVWIERRSGRAANASEERGAHHVPPDAVIVGYGPAGQAVGRLLAARRIPTLVLDLNPENVAKAARIGHTPQVGDALRADVLEHAGVAEAKWIVITIPARSAALGVLAQVRAMNPHGCVIVRARYLLHQAEFLAAGASVVVDDELEVGRRLGGELAAQLDGVPWIV